MPTKRQCERCKGHLPDRMSRQRDEDGNLVCDSCKNTAAPKWGIQHSSLNLMQQSEMRRREAEALASIHRIALLQREAHDSGDNALIHHCAFCGSGAVTGRSDGSAECDFCHNVFTVQVQPSHPNMPQTIDGNPVTPPGMPGGEEMELSSTSDPAVEETEDGVAADPLTEDATPAPASEQPGGGGAKPKKPNPFEKKSFRTATGATLDEDTYVAHLALEHADDREAVLDTVRVAMAVKAETKQAAAGDVECPACDGTGRDKDEDGDECYFCGGDGKVPWSQVEEWREYLESNDDPELAAFERRYPKQGATR